MDVAERIATYGICVDKFNYEVEAKARFNPPQIAGSKVELKGKGRVMEAVSVPRSSDGESGLVPNSFNYIPDAAQSSGN